MKVLKVLALILLSFLLFLSLSIFGLALTLNLTILNPDFTVSELDRLDIPSLTKDLLSQQIPQDVPYIAEVVDNTIADLEPWIRDQIHDTVYAGYDYLLGKSQSLNLVISLEPLRDSVKSNLREAILRSPPPELAGAPPAAVELYISEASQYVDEMIPPRFEFNESSLSPEALSQLTQVKQAVGYIQLAYKVLIAVILLLILGIVLINREVRGATRWLGIIFATYGAFEYLGIFILKNLAGTQLPQLGIPPPLQTWLPQLFNDLLVPLEIFSLSLLVTGIALIIVSFVYKPRQPSF
jgi:hypothetical protein